VSLESDQAARCRHISGQHASVVVWRKAWRPEEIAHHHVDGYLRAPIQVSLAWHMPDQSFQAPITRVAQVRETCKQRVSAQPRLHAGRPN
jgi:hypothetical protein